MMPMDRVPGTEIYIGSAFTLRSEQALAAAQITHVLSMLRPLPNQDAVNASENFRRLCLPVDDYEESNIMEHFPAANKFIQQALDEGGHILVHCAVGKSRSPTVVIAYLLRHDPTLTPQTALDLIRQVRPVVEPNLGFWAQLELYHHLHCPDDLDAEPAYQRWCYQQLVHKRLAEGRAPEAEELQYADESNHTPQLSFGDDAVTAKGAIAKPSYIYRCRRCRQTLAVSMYLRGPHCDGQDGTEPAHIVLPPTSAGAAISETNKPSQASTPAPECAHTFLDQPLSWMRKELEQGKLEGRLECPNIKCRTQVGRYAWQGLNCSCGKWVVPGLSLAASKTDRVLDRRKPAS